MNSGKNRLEILKQVSSEYHGGRLVKVLSDKEMGLVVEYIRENEQLSSTEFRARVAVLYTNGETRPKNHGAIQELLHVVASREVGKSA